MKYALIFGLLCAASNMHAMQPGKPKHTVMELRIRNGGAQDALNDDYSREILPVPGTIKDIAREKSETHLNQLIYVSAALGLALTAFAMYGIK